MLVFGLDFKAEIFYLGLSMTLSGLGLGVAIVALALPLWFSKVNGVLKMQDVKKQDMKLQDMKLQDMKLKMQEMKLLHILVVLLCYINDEKFKSLLSKNCFDLLFFCMCF